MTTTERSHTEKQAATLLDNLDPAIADSVVTHYGNPHCIGEWSLEEMMDDIISKLNDID